jgi:hypothetical protein
MIWSDVDTYFSKAKIEIEKPKPVLFPTFLLPDENGDLKAETDSTPLIRRIESEAGERSTIPTDPVLAFLNYLLEDFADEWCTKFMFHYRWNDKKDAENAGTILPLQIMGSIPDEVLDNFNKMLVKDKLIGCGLLVQIMTLLQLLTQACVDYYKFLRSILYPIHI